ncbi:hypothetical protein QBC41DRAFT_301663 [Cercophora samala]|uniref:Uncharacterized protein n=1 Tax=Cercophora samala TaxID=330535 RepID=A0AA39ZGP9_9PEZI|nr:hypothetical protein QBC41DRAFT_301663 [Cercophora samala]
MPRTRYGTAFFLPELALSEPVEMPVPAVAVMALAVAVMVPLTIYLLGPRWSCVFLPKWILDVLLAHFFDMPPIDTKAWCLAVLVVFGLWEFLDVNIEN